MWVGWREGGRRVSCWSEGGSEEENKLQDITCMQMETKKSVSIFVGWYVVV